MKTNKILTKEPMQYKSIYLPKADAQKWLAAAAVAGISRAELLRRALREKADSILNQRSDDRKVS